MNPIEQGCLVFDIGANAGYMAQSFIDAGATKVICVEPCLRIYNELAKRKNIIPIHGAVWSHPTVVTISFCQNEGGHSTCDVANWKTVFPDDVYDAPEYVPTTTLNELKNIFGLPHLIKIDTEGTEKAIVSTLNFKSNFLIFEYHFKCRNASLSILQKLKELGYTRADNLDGELDIRMVPTTPIADFIEHWKTKEHGLGNITAC